jgi:transcriptional regulator with XRE-family HTH domain
MNIKTDWFRARLAEREMSLRQLARDMELDPSAVSLMLRGKRRMTMAEAKKIADLLVLPPTEVMRAAGVSIQEDMVSVPIKLHFNARGVATQTQGDKKMQAPFDTPKNAVAGQVRAPSSQFDGWLFVISPVHGEPAKSIDRLVVAKLGKELRLGVLRRGYEQESYTLLPLQGAEKPDDVVVDSARTVLWVKP